MELFDIHTHQISEKRKNSTSYFSILDVNPQLYDKIKDRYNNQFFSSAIHPWKAGDSEIQYKHLLRIASDMRFLLIGETGLDKIKGPSLDIQTELFKQHIALSEKLEKPLIIHAVKAWQQLYHIRKDTKPTQPWIIHGFRGNPQITEQMARVGYMFSIGEKFNANSLQFIPEDSLFCETDESAIDIKQVYQQVADALNKDIEELANQISENVRRVFRLL